MADVVGVDLGTTYSAVARAEPGQEPVLLRHWLTGKPLTPSVVAPARSPPLVGDEAKELFRMGDAGAAAFFKRHMGDRAWAFEADGRSFDACDLSAMLLADLRKTAEKGLGRPVAKAVVTVPAHFRHDQREWTKRAAKKAGLDVLATLNEPSAAALALGLHREGGRTRHLVYDLGGGTFDASLVEVEGADVRVLATDGVHELGGKDWDDRVFAWVERRLREEHGLDLGRDGGMREEMLAASEAAKIQLSATASASFRVPGAGVRLQLTRDEFEAMTRDLLEVTSGLCERILESRGIAWDALDGVILVGGSTRMPMVRRFLEERTGRKPRANVPVDEAVALGAAVYATLLAAPKGGSLSIGGRALSDVTGHALGLVARTGSGFENQVLIPKDAPVPHSVSRPFKVRTRRDAPNALTVFLVQGDSPSPDQCHPVGTYEFRGVEHKPGGVATIDVEYSYDRDGLVVVAARQRGASKPLVGTRREPEGEREWERLPADAMRSLPYTAHAGLQSIAGAPRDEHGNAKGSAYDLAGDGAFEGETVAVINLWPFELDFRLAAEVLERKGFTVRLWKSVPSPEELRAVLDEASQLWIVSGPLARLRQEHAEIIRRFFDEGHGVFVWGDNAPYFADANLVARALVGVHMHGDNPGARVLQPADDPKRPGFTRHLLTTGIERLYEGVTVATVHPANGAEPFIVGSDGAVLAATYDRDGRRAIFDGGFTRLYKQFWDTAGTARYVANAAAWLANHERFQEEG